MRIGALKWEHNIWTGNDIARVAPTRRVIRLCGGGLYRVEEWDDYSLDFPKKGPWRTTLGRALADNP